MVVTINGNPLAPIRMPELRSFTAEYTPKMTIAQKVLFAGAASPSLIQELHPVYNMIGEVVAAVGILFIMGGIIAMMFKKKLGLNVIKITAAAILASCLVPSAVMLIIIIGRLMDRAITTALSGMGQ